MKLIRTALILAALTAVSTPALLAQAAAPVSPHDTISLRVGDRRTGNFVMVNYGRPYTKDPKSGAMRTVWGELVPWAKAWRLGANEATLLVVNKPIVIGKTTIPGGAYTLYLVPAKDGPTKLVFSTNIGKWGIPVDESQDFARVEMQKSKLTDPVHQLTLALEKEGAAGGVLKVQWEDVQYSVSFVNGS